MEDILQSFKYKYRYQDTFSEDRTVSDNVYLRIPRSFRKFQ